MALRYLEGFDWLPDNLDDDDAGFGAYLTGKYTQPNVSRPSTKPGRNGGTAVWHRANADSWYTPMVAPDSMFRTDPVANRTMVCGFAFKVLGSFPNGENIFWGFAGPGINHNVNLRFSNFGALFVRQDSVFYNDQPRWTARRETWYYMEVKVVVDSSPSGSVEIRVNEDVIYTNTGINTAENTTIAWDRVYFGVLNTGTGADRGIVFDDIYVCDGTGTINNDYLGDIQVRTVNPSGDGFYNTWSPTGAGTSNADRVNEGFIWDDDTTYLSTATTNDRQTFTHDAVDFAGGTIHGAQNDILHHAEDGEPRICNHVTRSGGVDADDTGETVDHHFGSDERYMTTHRVWEVDPNTGAKWTQANLNSAEFGFELGS